MKKWGKKIYIVAADYNYGQITAKWVTKYVREDDGGEVVAAEFFPLDVTDFGPTIKKIQAAKPDIVISALVGGGAHLVLPPVGGGRHEEAEIPMASTTFGGGNENQVLSPEERNGIIVSYAYFQELDTPGQQGVPREVPGQVRRIRPIWRRARHA